MAIFDATTSSNSPRCRPSTREYLEKFRFSCDVSVEVVGRDGELHLSIYGYDWLYVEWASEEEGWEECSDDFLEGIAEHLEEELVIQCIGATKCRFPLSAWEVIVSPDGKIECGGFKGY